MKNKNYIIGLGILIGIISVFGFPLLVVLGLAVYVVYLCRSGVSDPAEKRFITNVCILAIGIRILISFILLWGGWHSGGGSDIFGDARPYEGVGVYIKELATGVPQQTGLWGDNLGHVRWLREVWDALSGKLAGVYSVPVMAYWYAYFYTLWGLDFLAPKILNGLMWVLGSYWLYLFFRERFVKIGTKAGLLITLFLPSALMFSSSGLKDSLLCFFIITIIFSSHRLETSNHRWYGLFILAAALFIDRLLGYIGMHKISFFLITLFIISFIMISWVGKRYRLFYGPLIIPSYILLSALREHIGIIVMMFAFVILTVNKINFKKIVIGGFLIAIFLSVVPGSNFRAKTNDRLRSFMSTAVLQNYNTAYGNTAYHIYPERLYPYAGSTITYPELFFSFLNGLRYVFLEPTPWSFRSLSTIVMFPETLFMWFLAPFILMGILAILRIGAPLALPTLVFLFTMTCLLVFGQGNMGSLVRIRLMVMPWYFMLAGIGLNCAYSKIFKTKEKIARGRD